MMSHADRRVPAVLTIAGSDPSGGAGIQADIKTFTVLGVYSSAAITALTIQNTLGVSAVLPLPPDVVSQQVRAVLDDLFITHIKIGMVGSAEIAGALAGVLATFPGQIIYDPVAGSSAGTPLLLEKNHAALRLMAGCCTVLTPNLGELEILADCPCLSEESALAAAGELLVRYPRLQAICLTGGHLNPDHNTVTDYLLRPGPTARIKKKGRPLIRAARHPRISSFNTHGTGCTFASAFTAYHMRTGSLVRAFTRASAFLERLISTSAPCPVGHGTGPLLHHLMIAGRNERKRGRIATPGCAGEDQ